MTSSVLWGLVAAVVVLAFVLYLRRLRRRMAPPRKAYRFEERHVEVMGLRICYVEKNPVIPPVRNKTILFIHGLGGFLDNWDPNIPYFSRKYRCVALDLPGFGKSEKPLIAYSIPFYTDVVKAFADALGISRAVIVGSSMGGHIALSFALKYPGMVEKIVLVDSAGGWNRPNAFFSVVIGLFGSDWWVRHPSPWMIRRIVSRVFYDPEGAPAREHIRRYINWSRTKEFRLFAHAFYEAGMDTFFNTIRHRLKEIKVPTLIIWGKEDKLLPVGLAYSMHKRIPGSTLIVYERCGHMAMLEDPARFNRDVEKFLEARR